MKFKTLKYTLILSTILSSGIASAQKVDEPRAIALSNAMIQMFATTHLNKPDAQIKMTALIQNVSEADIRKENQQSLSTFASPTASMFATLEEQFGVSDFKVIKPAFEHQLKTQNSFYQSCKISGKVAEQQNDLLVPILCQIPDFDMNTLNIPERKSSESDAQFMARSIDTLSTSLDKAPKKAFPTHILIHRQDQLYIPEMDSSQYFPGSITQQISGTPEEELDTQIDEEDAAP